MNSHFQHFVDNFKTYSAIFSSVILVLCLIISLSATNQLFSAFGIDFFAYATLSDYLILGIRKMTASLDSFMFLLLCSLAVYSIVDFILFHDEIRMLDPIRELVNRFKNPVFLVGFLMITYTAFAILNNTSLAPHLIKEAKMEIQTVKYGKNETSISCLSYIGSSGPFSFFWSLSESNVKAINTSSIHLIESTIPASKKPYITATENHPEPQKPTKKYGIRKPKRFPLESEVYDKWRNEEKARFNNIKLECNYVPEN